LPFNLKNLKALQGGEYIRTRTLGGPTTEDVYTGLMSGARGLTVVSHNGVYTMDFNPTFRGGRRFSDKAGRMVGRYGHLLDAVRSGQVDTGGIDPSRMEELRTDANKIRSQDRDPEGYRSELARLVTAERRSPKLSREQQQTAALNFLNDYAEGAGFTVDRDGNVAGVQNPSDIVDRFVGRTADTALVAQNRKIKADQDRIKDLRRQQTKAENAARSAVGGGDYAQAAIHEGNKLAVQAQINQILDQPKLTKDEIVRQQRQRLTIAGDPVKTAQNVADALGIRDGYDAAMRKAEKENKQAMTPLQLNGEGYKTALDALQEQFPYYIDRVEFHPWADAKATPFHTDTGYVKPRFNRPAAALSGYFDPFIANVRNAAGQPAEHGKVYAESTRFQNRRPYPRKWESPTQERARHETARREGGEGGITGRGLSAESQQALRSEANLAMFKALHDAANFGANPRHPRLGDLGHARNTPIGSNFEDNQALRDNLPAIHRLRKMSEDEFTALAGRNPTEAKSMLDAANRENRAHGIVDVDADVQANFDRGGQPAEKKNLADLTRGAALDDVKGEFTVDDNPVYDAAVDTPSADIESAYDSDPDIQELVDNGVGGKKLPKELTNDAITDSMDALLKDLRAKRTDMRSKLAIGRDYTDAEWADLDRPARGLVKANLLTRRHKEAVKREAAAATANQPTNVTQILTTDLPTYQQMMEEQRRRGELPGS
jgi:hypothetical protein